MTLAATAREPAVVYIDDDASACAEFEHAFQARYRIVTSSRAALAALEVEQVAILAFEAQTFGSIGERDLVHVGAHRYATRLVIIKPWQHDTVAQLLGTACTAWHRSMTQARTLSHDLRTPLMSLLADAEHLSIVAADVPTLRDVADNMHRAARLVQQLVERLEI